MFKYEQHCQTKIFGGYKMRNWIFQKNKIKL